MVSWRQWPDLPRRRHHLSSSLSDRSHSGRPTVNSDSDTKPSHSLFHAISARNTGVAVISSEVTTTGTALSHKLVVQAIRAMLGAKWLLAPEFWCASSQSRTFTTALEEWLRDLLVGLVASSGMASDVGHLLVVVAARRVVMLVERSVTLVCVLVGGVVVLTRVARCTATVMAETGEQLSDRSMVGCLLLLWLSSTTVQLALHWGHLLPHHLLLLLLLLLGQGFDKLRLLEELDNLRLEHATQFIMGCLGQTHTLEEVVLVTQSKFPIRRQLQVHLGVVLRDLNSTVRLALDEEKWKLELLVGVGDRPVDIQGAFLVIKQLVGDLNISLLQLSDGNLLLDKF